MALYYNNTSIPQGNHVYINNQDCQKVIYNNVEVWRRSIYISNLISDSHEFSKSFSDIGYVKDSEWRYSTATISGHYYYFRFNVGGWGYSNGAGFGGWTKARHDGATEIIGKPMSEGLDNGVYTGHILVQSSGQTWGLNVEYYRNNATQGRNWTKESMMVDVTGLYQAGYTTPDAIYGKIGYFRGTKEFII